MGIGDFPKFIDFPKVESGKDYQPIKGDQGGKARYNISNDQRAERMQHLRSREGIGNSKNVGDKEFWFHQKSYQRKPEEAQLYANAKEKQTVRLNLREKLQMNKTKKNDKKELRDVSLHNVNESDSGVEETKSEVSTFEKNIILGTGLGIGGLLIGGGAAVALLSNPVGWGVLGVGALVGIGIVAHRMWKD